MTKQRFQILAALMLFAIGFGVPAASLAGPRHYVAQQRAHRPPVKRPARVDQHHRFLPVGQKVKVLPVGRIAVAVGGVTYYYRAGVFYRPLYPGFVVVAAPIGAVVRHLPPAYTVLHVGDQLFHHANATYYVWDIARGAYVVAGKPDGGQVRLAPRSELYIQGLKPRSLLASNPTGRGLARIVSGR